jgi:N-acetylmuramoyl-L-alanine amidase
MTEYFIHSTLALGIAYLIYRLLLRNAQAFHFNRFFLIGTYLLALSLPLIEFEISSNQALSLPFNDSTILEQKLAEEQSQFSIIEPINQNKKKLISIQNIYLLGLMLLSLRFISRLFNLYHLSRRKQFKSNGLRFILTQNDSIFSFFNCLFVPEKMYQKEQLPTELIDHEKVHANEMHSLDLILIEIGTLVAWLNPMVWLIKKAIEENHEFIADSKAAINKVDYCAILINSSNRKKHPLSSGFSYHSLKKRIQMINQPKPSSMKTKSKIIIALCGITVAFLFSSFQNIKITKPYTVIIDAGHGGKDKGASVESVFEKDLSLLYAQLISQKLAKKGIEVIQLRNKDEFMSLEERIKLTNQHKADLLLSIHVNKGPSEINGMQIYLSNNYIQEGDTNVNYFQSMRFASQLSQDYGTDLKIMPAPFTILKNVDCPVALVELGFLSNEKEREKLLNEKHQNQLSTLITNSVVKSMN